MILVDTSAWYALYIPRDEDHTRANEWRKANRERLVTTEQVLIETLNLLASTGEASWADSVVSYSGAPFRSRIPSWARRR